MLRGVSGSLCVPLNSHFHGNLWMRFVADNLEVFKLETVNVFHFSFDDELGEWSGLPLYL